MPKHRTVLCLVRLLVLAGMGAGGLAAGQQPVRVATYNIKFFKSTVSAGRLANLRQVVAGLDADIIGLQEIDDRAALAALFDPSAWDTVIDDDSGDDQDVALVVRRPLAVQGMSAGLDAQDQDFLFSGPGHDREYPNRRDLLCVQVSIPGESEPLFVMVHHAKSRLGGRDTTDPRREDAAKMLLTRLEQDFDGKRFVIMGDCNDNPDDRSMNILEAGQPGALAGPEEIEGPFLLNLCEALVAEDRVSWGLKASDIQNGVIDTVKPGSRQKNNTQRGTAGTVSPILFDQILIPVTMKGEYVAGSARVFDNAAALVGGADAASDHVPVFADFVFGQTPVEPPPPPPPPAGLAIVALLPDPVGTDGGHEEVVLANQGPGGASVNLSGWKLQDRAQNVFVLSGTVAAGAELTIVLPSGSMPLNNGGDEVALLNPGGVVVGTVMYGQAQVSPGVKITFP